MSKNISKRPERTKQHVLFYTSRRGEMPPRLRALYYGEPRR